jgi:hypothetical protein
MWLFTWLQKRQEQRKIKQQEELIFKLKNPNYRKRPAAK